MKPFAFVFPGQGSQSVGMLDAWGDHPPVSNTVAEASSALGQDVGRLIHEGPEATLALTVNTQLVMMVAGVACYRAWQAEGALLFLEDVSEDLYRVDRLLTQLRLAGVLDAVAGIVLGSFTEAESPTTLLQSLLLPLCQAQRKPLLAGWPAGHGTPNRPLPLGLRAELDADAGTLTLHQTLLHAPPAGQAAK